MNPRTLGQSNLVGTQCNLGLWHKGHLVSMHPELTQPYIKQNNPKWSTFIVVSSFRGASLSWIMSLHVCYAAWWLSLKVSMMLSELHSHRSIRAVSKDCCRSNRSNRTRTCICPVLPLLGSMNTHVRDSVVSTIGATGHLLAHVTAGHLQASPSPNVVQFFGIYHCTFGGFTPVLIDDHLQPNLVQFNSI